VTCGCGADVRVVRFQPTRHAPIAPRRAGPDAGTPCAYHAGNLATDTCGRCGSFVCDLCATPVERKTYCTACFERLHSEGRLASLGHHLPRPHSLALVLGILSLAPVVGLVFVPLSIWQGIRAGRRYRDLTEREDAVGAYLAVTVLLVMGGVALTVLVLRSS
jgi:hypothetical protein